MLESVGEEFDRIVSIGTAVGIIIAGATAVFAGFLKGRKMNTPDASEVLTKADLENILRSIPSHPADDCLTKDDLEREMHRLAETNRSDRRTLYERLERFEDHVKEYVRSVSGRIDDHEKRINAGEVGMAGVTVDIEHLKRRRPR